MTFYKCTNCNNCQDTTDLGECSECGYENLVETTEKQYNWMNYCTNKLDELGYIPSDWIIHYNGNIEHRDGCNYQKHVVISLSEYQIGEIL